MIYLLMHIHHPTVFFILDKFITFYLWKLLLMQWFGNNKHSLKQSFELNLSSLLKILQCALEIS